LNNLVEQDHRRVKPRIYPVHGVQHCRRAVGTSSGIELVQKIKQGPFEPSPPVAIGTSVPVAHSWEMVRAA
jgi:transposase-like protein